MRDTLALFFTFLFVFLLFFFSSPDSFSSPHTHTHTHTLSVYRFYCDTPAISELWVQHLTFAREVLHSVTSETPDDLSSLELQDNKDSKDKEKEAKEKRRTITSMRMSSSSSVMSDVVTPTAHAGWIQKSGGNVRLKHFIVCLF